MEKRGKEMEGIEFEVKGGAMDGRGIEERAGNRMLRKRKRGKRREWEREVK